MFVSLSTSLLLHSRLMAMDNLHPKISLEHYMHVLVNM